MIQIPIFTVPADIALEKGNVMAAPRKRFEQGSIGGGMTVAP
jgi:hypothetical protein